MTDQGPRIDHAVTSTVHEHVRGIIATAERAAADLQAEIEAEAARRAAEIIEDSVAEAERIRSAAEDEAAAYLDDARKRIDAFATARVDRIEALTASLVTGAEAIQPRVEDVTALQRELELVIGALKQAADATAAEAARAPIRVTGVSERAARPAARRDATGQQVRDAARDLLSRTRAGLGEENA